MDQAFRAASERLTGAFLEGGWVVSRKPDGSPEHQGEGLIWTGLAMGALPCDLGKPLEATLQDMVERHGGALVRYEPLGEYEHGREVTLDGALGLYLGVAQRRSRCGDTWAPFVGRHRDFVAAHSGRLHENVDQDLSPHFDYLLERLAGGGPDSSTRQKLENDVAGWALAVNAQHAACFRVNLGFMALETLEAMGERVSDQGKWEFCAATRGMDIPTVDHWCGRSDLTGWIGAFQPNQFEYRHQRCGAWESPDGDGDATPGLDLLVAMRQAYSLSP